MLKRLEWINIVFLVLSPVIAIGGAGFLIFFHAIRIQTLVFALLYGAGTGLAVTAGYHRLFAHRSYDASGPVKLLMLLLGAAAIENSALRWASDHRNHHKFVDTDEDPYNIKKGFLFAHIGWIFFKRPSDLSNVSDLNRDALLRWQDRHYFLLAVLMGFAFPMVVASLWNDPLGGLILGGFVRVVLNHHFTFSINSFCHYLGKQPYSERNSSRDSWIPALFTYGEGYHNFHHTFPSDYRNGIRLYHWDPTKWLIKLLAWMGQTHNLRRISKAKIAFVKLRMEEKRLLERLAGASPSMTIAPEVVKSARENLEKNYSKLLGLKENRAKLKKEGKGTAAGAVSTINGHLEELTRDLRAAKAACKSARFDWIRIRNQTA